ncbi:hypothetical protein B566_EDAN007547 [Ephemera danica]|nr:hypothetical protein B566_EDAN007547 [Ephemera danica]
MILVDWSVEAGNLWYPGINTNAIGNYLGYVLSMLKFNYYASYRRMHCIGHSLGTHVCNYASLYLGKSLGRITGLDPADLTGNMKPIRGNAHFTDIIHTTILFGDTSPLADADFYPNGGKNQGSECGQGK